jgi:hypothetical protein
MHGAYSVKLRNRLFPRAKEIWN